MIRRPRPRPWFLALCCAVCVGTAWLTGFRTGASSEAAALREESAGAGWQKGRGWGWIWGKQDEVGALNAMSPSTVHSALELAKEGRVYDLGVAYSRNSFKWPGHSPAEIMTFRGPEGE